MKRCYNCFLHYESKENYCPHCGYIKTSGNEEFELKEGYLLNNRYIIGILLGFGGFGITYKAWDSQLETYVAIKEYYPSGLVNRTPNSPEIILASEKRQREFYMGKERFLNEARNMAKFSNHTNIVNVFAYFEENNTAYIVMEFLSGISLGQYLSYYQGELSIEESLNIIKSLLKAVNTVHKSKIIHRDISPDNIYMCNDGSVKLIDFGAARFTDESVAKLTIVLKPGFAPPEQYDKVNQQGPWTDIYAIGAVLYLLISGIKPIESTNRLIEDSLVPLNKLNSNVNENLNNSIMRALALDQNLRFKSIAEFELALFGNKTVQSVNQYRSSRRSKRTFSFSLALIVLIVASFGVFQLYQNKQPTALNDATLNLWIIKEDSQKLEVFNKVVSRFNQEFDNITINLREINETEYEEQYERNLNLKDKAMIFESQIIKDKSNLESLDILKKSLSPSLHLISDSILERKLILGVSLPIVYINTILTDVTSEKNVWINNLNHFTVPNQDFAINRQLIDVYTSLFTGEGREVDEFYQNEVAVYLGSSKDYRQVQMDLAGRYKIFAINQVTNIALVEQSFSLAANLSADEKAAGIKFLEFLGSSFVQDLLFLQSESNYIPTNKELIETYSDIFPEFKAVLIKFQTFKTIQEQ